MGRREAGRDAAIGGGMRGMRAGLGLPRFGDEVKALRARLGLTQREFAGRYGIPVGNLRNWEQDARVASPDTASRLLVSLISVDPERTAALVARTRDRAPGPAA